MNVFGVEMSDVTASALLGLAVILILMGRIVPYRFYKNIIEERDTWKESALMSQRHVDKLLHDADVSVNALSSMEVEAAKVATNAGDDHQQETT